MDDIHQSNEMSMASFCSTGARYTGDGRGAVGADGKIGNEYGMGCCGDTTGGDETRGDTRESPAEEAVSAA